jgi:hypothetical protein
MVYTPYPPASEENPSILRSQDGITWTDDGVSNPVILAGSPGEWNAGENADPDFIYVSDYNKWFMVWAGQNEGGSEGIALAYSSDGKTWAEYDGVTINGNANPVILSGEDTGGQSWEVTSGGISKLQCPTLLYESDTFYLYYVDEVPGNNRGRAGFATFTWNNSTNDVENLVRYAGNPTIDLPADVDFNSGCGHLDLSKNPNDGLYYMYVVRQLAGSSSFELALLTSADMISWTNQGKVLERGTSGDWDDTHIYRSCPVVDSTGNIILFDTKIRLYYSGYSGGSPGIGIADIPETGPPEKFDGNGPSDVPAGLANQGLMGILYGDRIHLFYKQYHYEYNPITDTYTPRADVPTPRTWGTCAIVSDSIYIIGGYSYGTPSGATNVNEVYDPATDTWTTKTAMPVSKYGVTRENPVINGIIYVTHGLNGGFHTDNYAYDPATDTWEQKSSAVHPRDGVGCCVFNNKLYVVGGRDDYISGGTGTNYVEEYDPLNDSPGSSWNKTIIARSGDPGLLGARSCGLGDIDSDGDLDIAVAVDRSPGRLYWYQNPGGSAALDSSLWNEYLIDATPARGADAQVGDIDKDGNPDIVYAEVPSNLYIYFAPADPTNLPGWTRVSIGGDTYHVYLVDFDGDGDLDILRAAAYSALVSWLENPYPTDPRTPINWNEYIIEQNTSISIANRVSTADIDGDGDLDIGMDADPSSSTGTFKWYRRPDDPTNVGAYEIYVIDDDPAYTAYAHDSYLADIDMDGDIDMAGVGPNAQGGTVMWWINDTTTVDTTYASIDPNKWDNGGGMVSDSILTITGSNVYTRSRSQFQYKALRCEARYAVYANYGDIGFNKDGVTVGQNDAMYVCLSGPTVRSITSGGGGFTWGYSQNEGTDWKIWEILWRENEARFYVDNTLRYTHITNVPSIPLNVQFNTYSGSPTIEVDWVLVRNYTSTEPTAALGQASSQGVTVYLSPPSDTIALDSLGLVNIDYDDMGNTAQPLKGYDIKITFNPTVVEVDSAYSGGFLGASSAFFLEILGTDTVRLTEARLDTGGVSGSGTLATIVFRGIGGGTTPLEYTSVSLRDTLNDPISATTQAGSLSVDGYLPTMKPIVEAEGQYYSYAPSFSIFGFDDNWDLDDGFYQMDSYAGTWVNLFTDWPDTTWDSTGWTIPGFDALFEEFHTIYFMATDDAGNQEGESGEWSWSFYKDTTAPGSVTDFTAEPGHNKVSLSWTNPVGAIEGTLIRRVAWNDYPQYDTTAPNYPGSPTADDSVVFLPPTESTYVDTLLTRDIYYYTIFARDSAGNYSSADTSAQDRSTCYWLGDVTDTSGTVGNYDGYVDFEDLMIFSGCFSTSEGDASWEPEFDIGPTDDSSRVGIPQPDNVIDFEDLMIFAMNYWMVGPFVYSAVSGPKEDLYVELELPTAELLVGEEFETKLIVNNGADLVKGMHLVLDFDSNSLEFIGVQESDLLKSQEAKVFFKATNAKGKLDISMAVLGTGVTLAESGEIAILKFKLLSNQVTEINLKSVDLRSSENQKLQCSFGNTGVVGTGRSLPKVYALHQNHPNPFSAATDINYQIPKNSRVILQVYDLTGQLVRTLMDKIQTAGYYIAHWDGKDRTGNAVAPGVYFCRLTLQSVHVRTEEMGTASSHSFIKKMILVR